MDEKADVKRRDSSHPSPGAHSMERAQQQYHYRPSDSQLLMRHPSAHSHEQPTLLPPILHSQPMYATQPAHYAAPTNPYIPYQNGAMQPALMPSNVNGQSGVMSFAIPRQAPQESRHLSGSHHRHKKEIKRRTKTGCLTCRKRRIKVS